MKINMPLWMRTIAVTLLIAMLYYFAGYRLVYSLIIHGAKEDAAFAIGHKQALVKELELTASEYSMLKWTDKDKEFTFNDQLYDIVSIQQTDGKYIMQVYADKNETGWVNAMNTFIKGAFSTHSGKGMDNAESLSSAFQKEYTPTGHIRVGHVPETKTVQYSDTERHSSTQLKKPIWHPPACCILF
ncbi:MAG TPA: hypothetical protein VNZ45_17720 [Bacteroidia bacterium]|jgi:hypothetical protein|nr:hypothetical protein [Bacteroidia bacterium]